MSSSFENFKMISIKKFNINKNFLDNNFIKYSLKIYNKWDLKILPNNNINNYNNQICLILIKTHKLKNLLQNK